METLDILYLVLWAGLGAYCVYSARKLGAILYIMGGFFAFMFFWRLAHALTPLNLYDSVYGIIFRCVGAAFFAVIVIMYLRLRKKSQ